MNYVLSFPPPQKKIHYGDVSWVWAHFPCDIPNKNQLQSFHYEKKDGEHQTLSLWSVMGLNLLLTPI